MASRETRAVSAGQKISKICEVNYIHTSPFYCPHSPLHLQPIAEAVVSRSLSGGLKDFAYQVYGLMRLELFKNTLGISS
jgi:hypothetical protein